MFIFLGIQKLFIGFGYYILVWVWEFKNIFNWPNVFWL